MTTMPYGRYRGAPIENMPRSYCEWLSKQPFVRPELQAALKRRLGPRTASTPVPPALLVRDFKMAAAGTDRGGDA